MTWSNSIQAHEAAAARARLPKKPITAGALDAFTAPLKAQATPLRPRPHRATRHLDALAQTLMHPKVV